MRPLFQALLVVFCAICTQSVRAEPVILMVSRNAEVTVVYLRAELGPMADAFQGTDLLPPVADMAGATFFDGQVLAQDTMDRFADRIELIADGQPVPLQTLPAIFHHIDEPLLYETPIDASVASAFCTTPDRALPEVGELMLYGAWLADVPLEVQSLTLGLAMPEDAELAGRLIGFRRGELGEDKVVSLQSGERIVLSEPAPRGLGNIALPVLLLLLLTTAVAGWIQRRRVRPQ